MNERIPPINLVKIRKMADIKQENLKRHTYSGCRGKARRVARTVGTSAGLDFSNRGMTTFCAHNMVVI